MDRKTYTETVLSVLRHVTGRERSAIREEIDGHIEDHMEGLIELGYDPALAEERTLAAMGDPKEVGRELNKQYPLCWLAAKWAAMAVAALLVFLLTPSFFQRLPDAWDSIQVRWAPKTVLDISRVREDFDPLGVPACDMDQEAAVEDVHFRIYQLGYREGHVLLAVASWRDNPFLEQLDWTDGYSVRAWVNGELTGCGISPGKDISLYELWAGPGDTLTLVWEVYGQTGTVAFRLPEEAES